MRKLLTILFLLTSLNVLAQQNSLLDQAFWQGKPDVETVKAEVAKGNSPSASNAMAMDAVVMAINANAPVSTIKFLLDQPGNTPDKPTHDARTYLHWAAGKGNTEIMEYLFTKGAKPSIVDSHGATPLTLAAGSGQADTRVYDILLAHGDNLKTNLNTDGANALLLAVGNDKDFALTNYFIAKGLSLKSVDAAGNNAFSYAAKAGNINLLKALLAKGVTVNDQAILMAAQGGGGRRPGMGGPGGNMPQNGGTGQPVQQGNQPMAAGGNGMAIFEYLESVGVKVSAVNKSGQNVLHFLVRKPNQNEIIKHFIQAGVEVNQADEDGYTPLMYAASSNRDTTVFEMLISKSKNINQPNRQGQTALSLAVKGNSPQIVAYLIAKGMDAKVLDTKGNNLFFYAIEGYGSGERQFGGAKPADFDAKLEILQKAGLDISKAQGNGNTLYHLAVAKNNLALVKRLVPLNIGINIQNKDGITALHRAAMIGKDDVMLKYLIGLGASKEIKTSFDETAFDLASSNEALKKNNVSIEFLK